MKKNSEGFMIMEALIVSTIVLGILIFMFSQFKSITNGFNQTFKYNTVENVYKANEIKKFIETDATDNMISLLNESQTGYLDVTQCDINTYNNVNFCKYLYEKLDIKSVILLTENVTSVVGLGMGDIDNGTKNFLKYIKNNYTGNYHRIVVSYNDNTYATLRIDILNDIYDYMYTGSSQEFVAPIDGYYQIELWGANGSYTKGIIYLNKNVSLYIYVGALNENYQTSTDVRLIDGNYNLFDSLKTRIMVAKGEKDGYYSQDGFVSFVSGYDRCNAISESSTENNILYTNQSIHYSKYSFEHVEIIESDEEIPNYEEENMNDNLKNGYVRITSISG